MAKSLSIEDALQWTQHFVLREWKLLLPVALAFLALPQLALAFLLPPSIANAVAQLPQLPLAPLLDSAPWLLPVLLLVQLLSFAGVLAIVALASVPRISVREALQLGVRRLFVLIVAVILVFVGEMILATLIGVVLTLLRLGLAVEQSLLFGVIIGITLVAFVRLLVLAPVVVGTRAGPIAALRLAWELSEGAFWRLLGALLVYTIGGLVVVFASAFALGSVFELTAGAAGARGIGILLSTVYLRFVLAFFWAGLHILAVALYRQLGGSIRGI